MELTQSEFRNIQEYGTNPLDEASRALLNVCWIAGCLAGIAEDRARNASDMTLVEVLGSSGGSPEFIRQAELSLREHKSEVNTEWWPRWTKAVPRGVKALHEVDWTSAKMNPDRAYQIITEWRTLFFDPMTLHGSEKAGDHLFRSAAPLWASRDGRSNLDFEKFGEMQRELELIAQRLRLISDIDIPDELRSARWYNKATKGGLGSAMLRQAEVAGKLPGSSKPRKRWLFPIPVVIREFPEFKKQIEYAKSTQEP